jgi:Family of unknown function (DUF6788)
LLASGSDFAILSIIMARVYFLRRKSTLALRQRKVALLRQLALPPHAIRASVVERFGTCGKSNCACHQGQKHGPYYYLTQCLAPGRVQKFLLKSPADRQSAREATAAFNGFYDGLEELSQINTELLRRGEPLLGGSKS